MSTASWITVQHRARSFAQWLGLGTLVGLVCGGASALFLFLLEEATGYRGAHPGIVYWLPVAGLAIGALKSSWGVRVLGGNNLILETVHEDRPELPLRMAPLALVGTVLTHLFGGSAGREGTAVQMGASLADWIAHRFRVSPDTRRELLAAGIAGGFGSVFGTPIAGAVFGLEVVVVGRLGYEALVPALVAAVVGDLVTRGLGILHTPYPEVSPLGLTPLVLIKWVVFALAVAAVAVLFMELTGLLRRWMIRWIPNLSLRMALGGAVLVLIWKGSGTDDYLGLGIPTLLRAFTDPTLPSTAFLLKLLFTAVTLSAGFLGGEVTPLFFIGATLGNALGRLLDLPLDLAAGVGMAATFAAAANTPLALSIMAVELLGAGILPHVVLVSVVAYLFTGQRGIYPSQRIARLKHGGPLLQRLAPLQAVEDPGRGSEPPGPG